MDVFVVVETWDSEVVVRKVFDASSFEGIAGYLGGYEGMNERIDKEITEWIIRADPRVDLDLSMDPNSGRVEIMVRHRRVL